MELPYGWERGRAGLCNGSSSVKGQVLLVIPLLLHWTVLAEGSPVAEPAAPAISFQCIVLMEKKQ